MEGLKTLNGQPCQNIKDILLQKVDQLKTFIETHITCGEVTTTTAEPLLLDLYPNPLVAYSLRKLNSDYLGNCIKIRRSSDNATQDIGFLNNVVDELAMTSFIGAYSGFVDTWYDQSGNNNHATQANIAVQPYIISSGIVIKEGALPILQFGTGGAVWIGLPTGLLYNSTTLSYFHVAKVIDYASSNSGVFGPSSTYSVGLEILQHSIISRRTLLRVNNTVRNNNSGDAYQLWNDNVLCLSSIFGNASSVAAYKNGGTVTLTSSAAMPALNFNGIYGIGSYGGGPMRGRFSELVIYESDESSSRTGIEDNINNYYSIY